MATYKIEVRERTEHPNFFATYEVQAVSVDDAITQAMLRFVANHPNKAIDRHSFEHAR